MTKQFFGLSLLFVFLLAGLSYWVVLSDDGLFIDEIPLDAEEVADGPITHYEEEFGLGFTYLSSEDGYVLIEPPAGSQDHTELVKAFVLMKTVEYEELQGAEGREGPPAITVTVFEPAERHLPFWLEKNVAYTGYTSDRISVVVGGITGLSYETDGLYRGTTVAVLHGDFLYLFSASYHEVDDGRLNAFAEFLETVEFDGLENVTEKDDLIRLFTPGANEAVSSPLVVRGEARGGWFFEATFPVVLTDWDGLIIAQGIATALDEWMSESYVSFEATLEFDPPGVYDRGSLILQRSNASGLPEHDNALEIPVRFSEIVGGK